MDIQTLVTVGELGDLLKVSIHTIYYWVERHEIPYLKIGRHLRFNAREVLEHFNRRTKDEKATCLQEETLIKKKANHGSHGFHRSLKTGDRSLA